MARSMPSLPHGAHAAPTSHAHPPALRGTVRPRVHARRSPSHAQVELEKKHAEQFNRKLKRETGGENNMPQVLDYVAQKAELYELEKEIKNWERKVEIAEIDWRRKQPAARR